MPDVMKIQSIEEPWIKATIFVPDEYLGPVMTLCTERRGEQLDLTYAGSRAMVVYPLPLHEVAFEFYDRLKSVSRGNARFHYPLERSREADHVKLSNMVNQAPADASSMIVPRRTEQ